MDYQRKRRVMQAAAAVRSSKDNWVTAGRPGAIFPLTFILKEMVAPVVDPRSPGNLFDAFFFFIKRPLSLSASTLRCFLIRGMAHRPFVGNSLRLPI